ncbi:MAG: hypothetical protein ABIU05_17530, partial [Nitrospirales bacterium]
GPGGVSWYKGGGFQRSTSVRPWSFRSPRDMRVSMAPRYSRGAVYYADVIVKDVIPIRTCL